MDLRPEDLGAHLARGLAPLYVVWGEEPLANKKAITINPSHIYYTNMGDAYRLKGKPEMALEYYQQAIRHQS